MRTFRTYRDVQEPGTHDVLAQVLAQRARLAERLTGVGSVVAVASGKGGVGKSAVTANLAASLAGAGLAVGALDADLNGPSLARMLGAAGGRLVDHADGVEPVVASGGVKVISMELLQDAPDAPLRWRDPGAERWLWQGTLETGALREFLSDVVWGELDVLLVDVPPGTDRIGRLLELVPEPAAVLLVTTPTEMSCRVVARSARLVREAGVATAGLVANMTDWVCPDCGARTGLWGEDAVDGLAERSGLEVWARVPFDPRLARETDRGRPFVVVEPVAPAARALEALARSLRERLAPRRPDEQVSAPSDATSTGEEGP